MTPERKTDQSATADEPTDGKAAQQLREKRQNQEKAEGAKAQDTE